MPVQPRTNPNKEAKRALQVDPTEEFNKILDRYRGNARNKVNILIAGDYGGGKTYGLHTAPGPVLIDSFDPGGTDCLAPFIDSGRLLIDTAYEAESMSSPFAFRLWEQNFWQRKKTGFFHHVGTYVIDSHTMWSQALMNLILRERGRKIPQLADLTKDPDIVPEIGDYNVHQKTISNYLAEIASLPCHTIIIAHLRTELDSDENRVSMIMMDGKKFAQQMPALFSEFWIAESRPAGTDREYFYRLVPFRHYQARSRLRANGRLGATEPQDIAGIFKKVGVPYEDKVYVPPEE